MAFGVGVGVGGVNGVLFVNFKIPHNRVVGLVWVVVALGVLVGFRTGWKVF